MDPSATHANDSSTKACRIAKVLTNYEDRVAMPENVPHFRIIHNGLVNFQEMADLRKQL